MKRQSLHNCTPMSGGQTPPVISILGFGLALKPIWRLGLEGIGLGLGLFGYRPRPYHFMALALLGRNSVRNSFQVLYCCLAALLAINRKISLLFGARWLIKWTIKFISVLYFVSFWEMLDFRFLFLVYFRKQYRYIKWLLLLKAKNPPVANCVFSGFFSEWSHHASTTCSRMPDSMLETLFLSGTRVYHESRD